MTELIFKAFGWLPSADNDVVAPFFESTSGARVDIEAADDGRIIITRSLRRFTLEELLARMLPEREHRLEDDDPKGEEII